MSKTEIAAAVARMQRRGETFPRFEVRAVPGGWTYSAAGGIVFSDRVAAETDAGFARDWEGR